MKYIRISLIIISILTLVTASLALCHKIPVFEGIAVSLSLIAAEFALQAVVARKVRNRGAVIAYAVAAAVIVGIVVYNVITR